jgi:Flp pilus assembly protein TadD
MSQQDELGAKIGDAWKSHHEGQNETAIVRFKEITEEVPEHIDALWGLGLSYRNTGDTANALQAFGEVKELVAAELRGEPEDYERFLMLQRMVDQQIEQINEFHRE